METRANTLDEALHVLDRAIRENKNELVDRFNKEFRDLGSGLAEMVPQMKDAVKRVGNEAKRKMVGMTQEGIERSKELAEAVDRQVHRNPWAILGGVLIGSLLLGFLMGRMRTAE